MTELRKVVRKDIPDNDALVYTIEHEAHGHWFVTWQGSTGDTHSGTVPPSMQLKYKAYEGPRKIVRNEWWSEHPEGPRPSPEKRGAVHIRSDYDLALDGEVHRIIAFRHFGGDKLGFMAEAEFRAKYSPDDEGEES